MATGTTSITTQDIAAIRATRDPWIKASLERNWDKLLGLCSKDVVFLPPDAPSASGAKACRKFLEGYPEIKKFNFEFDDITGAGDHASAHGHFNMVVDMDGSDVKLVGKFVDTFRKDGKEWRYTAVIWNSDKS